MNRILTSLCISYLALVSVGCGRSVTSRDIPDDVYDRLAISNENALSAASKRAIERNYDQGPEWYCEFRTHDVKGDLQYEDGVILR